MKRMALAVSWAVAGVTFSLSASGAEIQWLNPGHGGGVRASAIGLGIIATGGGDGSIHLRHSETRKYLKSIVGHTGAINDLAFSEDGIVLASASSDGSVRLHNVNSGASATLAANPAVAQAGVAFQSGSNRLVTLSVDGALAFWNLADNSLAGQISTGSSATRFALAPSGDRVAVASGAQIRLISLAEDSSITLDGHTDFVDALAFSPDGRLLASGASSSQSGDHVVRVWDTQAGEEIAALEGHEGGITAVAFAPNPNHIISASADQTVKVWDLAQRWEVGSRNILNPATVSVSPDARLIIVVGEVLNPLNLDLIDLLGHVLPVKALAFSPDGSQLVSDDELAPRIWNAGTGQGEGILLMSNEAVRALSTVTFTRNGLPISFSPDAQTILAQDYLWSAGPRRRGRGCNACRLAPALSRPIGKRQRRRPSEAALPA
jgi:WD40 repeat protein